VSRGRDCDHEMPGNGFPQFRSFSVNDNGGNRSPYKSSGRSESKDHGRRRHRVELSESKDHGRRRHRVELSESREHGRRHRVERSSKDEGEVGSDSVEPNESIPPHIVEVEGLFMVDTSGDELNLKYGKPYKKNVPKYYRYTSKILGMSPSWRIRHSKEDLANSVVLIEKIARDTGHHDAILWTSRRSLIARHPVKMIPSSGGRDSLLDDVVLLEDDGSEDYLDHLLRRRGMLQNRLTESPGNVSLWFDAVENERRILKYSHAGARVNDVIYFMLEKAVAANPSHTKLIREYMKSRALMGYSVASKWREWVVANPSAGQYWQSWIDSYLIESTNGGVLDVVVRLVDYERLFDILEVGKAQLPLDLYEATFVRVLFKICCMLKDAGYEELSIGVMQAMVELSFFCPIPDSPLEIQLSALEQFWKMESLRVGDKGAPGWNNTEELELPAKTERPLPGRSLDEDVEMDPFRVVLFDDIRRFLNRMVTDRGQTELLWSFMSLLGAQVPWEAQHDDNLLDDTKIILPTVINTINSLVGAATDKGRLRLNIELASYQGSSRASDPADKAGRVPTKSFLDGFWMWALKYVGAQYGRLAKKLLKLDCNRQNMVLWAQYAFLEFDTDKNTARSIFKNGSEMVSFNSKENGLMFWNKWVEGELKFGNVEEVKDDIMSLFQLLSSGDPHSIDEMCQEKIQSAILARFLLSYISATNVDIERSISEFWADYESCPDHVKVVIDVLELYILSVDAARPTVLRDFLGKCVIVISDLDVMMKLADFERRYGRSFWRLTGQDTPTSFIVWYLYGLRRDQTTFGMRQLYETAVEGARSPKLWEMYVDYEVRTAQQSATSYDRARAVLNRALAQCGWCVNLYKKSLQAELANELGPLEQTELERAVIRKGLRCWS
jgi:hypothetical protein